MTVFDCIDLGGLHKVSRKEKSLGLLCENFIKRFPEAVPEGEKCEIPLDDLAKAMLTERRRIYDIVNVLEAVQMMTKVNLFLNFLIGKNLQCVSCLYSRLEKIFTNGTGQLFAMPLYRACASLP